MADGTIGIAINGTGALEVGHVPGASQMALYEVVDGEIRVLAYFRSPPDAARTVWWLQFLAESSQFHARPDALPPAQEDGV